VLENDVNGGWPDDENGYPLFDRADAGAEPLGCPLQVYRRMKVLRNHFGERLHQFESRLTVKTDLRAAPTGAPVGDPKPNIHVYNNKQPEMGPGKFAGLRVVDRTIEEILWQSSAGVVNRYAASIIEGPERPGRPTRTRPR